MNKLVLMLVLVSTVSLYGQEIPYNQEFQVNTYTRNLQNIPSSAPLANGGFVICWQGRKNDSYTDIFAQQFDSHGNKLGLEFQVNTYTDDTQWYPAISSLANGGYVICWMSNGQDGSERGVYAQQYDANGNIVGEEFRVNTYTENDQGTPSIALLANGDFLICWDSVGQDGSGSGIYAQRFDSEGNKVGNEFMVNTHTIGSQARASIASLDAGGFVISWMSDQQNVSGWDIYAQIFDADGNKSGNEFMVNSYTDNIQWYPAITSFSNGGFVICWTSAEMGGSYYGIYAQRFDFEGNSVGEEFCVDTSFVDTNSGPSIATLNNGGFVISWTCVKNNDFGFDIYALRYDSAGNRLNKEFQVNTYENNFQQRSSIAALKNGDFVICWDSNLQDGSSYGIYAKYFLDESINHTLNEYSIILPLNDQSIATKRPDFTWQKASNVRKCYPWEIEYDLYLSTDEQFIEPIIFNGLQDTTCTIPKADSLQAGQTYFWKVLAKNMAGNSLWSSNTNAFFVSHNATEVKDETQLPTGYVLEQNYPNPFNPVTTVRYTLPQSGQVELVLYDITGRQVIQLVNGMQSTGTHTVKIDGSDLASGVYVYTLKSGAFSESKKMVLVR